MMTRRTKTTTGKRDTGKLLSVVTLLAIALLTSLLVYLTFGTGDRPSAFFARSINDAAYDCEDRIDRRYGKHLISKHYDQFSSRYEADDHQYVIYYRVSVQEQDDGGFTSVKNYMAKCIVWEKLGYVSDFQVFKDF